MVKVGQRESQKDCWMCDIWMLWMNPDLRPRAEVNKVLKQGPEVSV